MKVLITGGTGFLGQQLALTLRSLGDTVTVVGRNRLIGQQLATVGIDFLAADLRDAGAIVAACKGQECVFHCGALSAPWGRRQDFYDTNVLGTRHVVQGCLAQSVQRLVHVSTSAVYFTYAHQRQIRESQPFAQPVNAYAATKQMAEQELAIAQSQGLSVLTIRPRGIFGPGDSTILPRLLQASDRAGIPLMAQGQAMLDVTYIDNVVDALRCCQMAPASMSGGVYNITNGEPLMLFDLLGRLSAQLGQPLKFRPMSFPIAYGLATMLEGYAALRRGPEPVMTRYTVGLLAFSQTLAIDAAIAELGYRPQISLDAGLTKFAQWWQQHG